MARAFSILAFSSALCFSICFSTSMVAITQTSNHSASDLGAVPAIALRPCGHRERSQPADVARAGVRAGLVGAVRAVGRGSLPSRTLRVRGEARRPPAGCSRRGRQAHQRRCRLFLAHRWLQGMLVAGSMGSAGRGAGGRVGAVVCPLNSIPRPISNARGRYDHATTAQPRTASAQPRHHPHPHQHAAHVTYNSV